MITKADHGDVRLDPGAQMRKFWGSIIWGSIRSIE
jgi:hypothetical protein